MMTNVALPSLSNSIPCSRSYFSRQLFLSDYRPWFNKIEGHCLLKILSQIFVTISQHEDGFSQVYHRQITGHMERHGSIILPPFEHLVLRNVKTAICSSAL